MQYDKNTEYPQIQKCQNLEPLSSKTRNLLYLFHEYIPRNFILYDHTIFLEFINLFTIIVKKLEEEN